MSMYTIQLRNEQTGAVRELDVGFSWRALFLGFVHPVIGRDIGMALAMAIMALPSVFLALAVNLVFAFFVNRWMIERALDDGFAFSHIVDWTAWLSKRCSYEDMIHRLGRTGHRIVQDAENAAFQDEQARLEEEAAAVRAGGTA